ncbi:hypothetical protein Cfla_1171 [Cellulomonas flavigena DSM 20109]|uniref:PknH-like extracellular domain-containing protein n=1 Tax=Cellulomonas flavigena (strain ATCC 482 / DSM 20109 / BCRC 11376 / JCM 18109 / NBRC 3775 / NCIMB 8073 / NRS 134) TaxID=446466 RepID=D5UBI0_CELFN|nr:hypothetical protein [Cellulomonas flavigena]ADG74075.1 hypothetical protein Cfla_1171 [Cellulomonas flavigena DSM 20109]
MSGTAPEPSDAPVTSADVPVRHRGPGGARSWWWLALVLVLGIAMVLVWQPWQGGTPAPVVTVSATLDDSSEPTPEPTATTPAPTTSAVPPPGAAAVFDAATAGSLFATAADLRAGLPGAADGVTRGREPGANPWGLPAGAVVDPASCTAAVTIVTAPPLHHDAASFQNDVLTYEQDVVLLLDAAAARAAFRALVTTVDECPEYTQVTPDVDGVRWAAEPALEGQGVFPAIVRDLTVQVEGDTFHQTTGHVLVGNAILTWTATALDAEDRDAATAVLGTPDRLSEVAERRALAALRGLS